MLIELMMAATDISLVPANLSVVCISNHGIFPYFRVFLGDFTLVFRCSWCPECNTLTLWSTRSHGIEKINRHHLMIKTSLIGFFSALIHYLPAASSTCADKNYDLVFCAGLLRLH
jgi:hypothetical protein